MLKYVFLQMNSQVFISLFHVLQGGKDIKEIIKSANETPLHIINILFNGIFVRLILQKCNSSEFYFNGISLPTPPPRIEKVWVRDGAAYFYGPIFIHPEETEHEPTKMFYKKEVFLSNLEETCPMTCILGRYLRHFI